MVDTANELSINTFAKLYENFRKRVKKNSKMLLDISLTTRHENIYLTIAEDQWLTDTIEIIVQSLNNLSIKYKLFYRLKV